MSNTAAVTAIIDQVFASTKKKFVSFKAIDEMLPKGSRKFAGTYFEKTGYAWKTMVISGHGFKKEFQAKYNREAKVNIPKIYYGIGGYENYNHGGGCCYVLVRK